MSATLDPPGPGPVVDPFGLGLSLDVATAGLAMQRPAPEPIPVRELRRRRSGPPGRGVRLALTSVDGVLEWDEVTPRTFPGGGRRARRAAMLGIGGTVVREYAFDRLGTSQVTQFLATIDAKLNGHAGLRQLVRQPAGGFALVPLEGPPAGGRALLFVHGTFSESDAFFRQLADADGQALLATLAERYARILAFDHPTLSVSPLLNALDLARALERAVGAADTAFDVVCHSRGGLVVRWWLQAVRRPGQRVERVVFVGSPLAGTSLASPASLRRSLDLLANVGAALGAAAGGIPFLTVSAGLMKVLASVAKLGARSPLMDAVIAMIPGLFAQSRVANNVEITRLRTPLDQPAPRVFAVRSNFEPEAVGWRFWRLFSDLKGRAADAGADLVFRAENDLVVDAASTTDLYDGYAWPAADVLDFGTTNRVHHCNYFEQDAMRAALARWLD